MHRGEAVWEREHELIHTQKKRNTEKRKKKKEKKKKQRTEMKCFTSQFMHAHGT